jgi:molecular chaperone GrpE
MSGRVKIPIRVVRQDMEDKEESPATAVAPLISEARPPVVEAVEPVPPAPTAEAAPVEKRVAMEEEQEMWRDRALRLEAEMDNFRKRQQRLAEERILADRERLLRGFLALTDDLARALAADEADVAALREGVALTYQGMLRLLGQEGAEPVPAEGEPFNPEWHEAVGTVPHQTAGVEPDRVAEVVRPGYRIGERLLRPAQVIVAT